MKILRLFSLFLITLSLVCCGSEQPAEKEPETVGIESIFGTENDALFRGSDISDLPEKIRSRENGTPTVDSDSLIEYEYTFQLHSGITKMHIYYTFDEFGLFEIQADLYPENEE